MLKTSYVLLLLHLHWNQNLHAQKNGHVTYVDLETLTCTKKKEHDSYG